jgi:hypothetical protein
MSEASANPPEELLIEPSTDPLEALGEWLVVARNRRVNRDWEALVDPLRMPCVGTDTFASGPQLATRVVYSRCEDRFTEALGSAKSPAAIASIICLTRL